MTPDRWEQVQRLFHDALDESPDRRADLLRGADADVRAEVEAMLAADTDPPSVFKTLTKMQGASRHAAGDTGTWAVAGHAVGPYRIVREIGRGGMGAVYLARRDDVERDVALKLVKSALAAPEVVARFMLERRVLARLDHPNVARLLDAGVADAGPLGETPYFAMEYVAGQPITAFADARTLDLEARLRLFLGVCEAVHYAHQRLVVHRDLKPSNVLVAEGEGGQPHVKLLDFGIAKLMAEDDHGAGLTRTGLRIMTPEYAAPEQIRAEAVTTATDVYALGVLLHELLTGRRPYDLADRSPTEIERIVCVDDVPKPSSRVAEGAGVERGMLRQQLEGDLDTIILKALEKTPARRYASAEALADDLRRYLDGRPVEARPQTSFYRLGKFVRRNRRGVAVGLGVVLVLAALVGFFTARLAAERDLAQSEAVKSEQVSAFLVDLFEAASPFGEDAVRTDTMTAPTLLARGAARVEADLGDQPDVQGELLHRIGHAYLQMGRFDEAAYTLNRALDLRRAHLDPLDPDIPFTLNTLGRLAVAQSEYERAEAIYRQALDLNRAVHEGDHTRTATSLDGLGTALRYQGKFLAADSIYTEALAMLRRLYGDEHADVTAMLGHLAFTKVDLGDYEAARPLYRDVVARTEAQYGRAHPATLAQLNNYGVFLQAQGYYAEVEPVFRDLVERNRSALGASHPRVAFALINLGSVLRDQGKLAEAEAALREAVAVAGEALGTGHEHYAGALAKLGITVHERGRSGEAEGILRQAVALHSEHLPRGHWQVARSEGYLGACLLGQGRTVEAERLVTRSHRTLEATFGPGHYVTRESARRVAALYETIAARDSG